jgi:ABC-type multidrug transport system fused ATPase/permease subunit
MKSIVLISAFIFVMVFAVGFFLRTVVFPQNAKQQIEAQAKGRPEQACYERGYFTWLSMSWVDAWIAYWGNSMNPSETKIEPAALGKHGWPDDEATPCGKEFLNLWKERVARSPNKTGSLGDMIMCVVAFAGSRRIFLCAIACGVYQSIMYIGPALGIRTVVQQQYLAEARYMVDPGRIHLETLFGPTLTVILMFFVAVTVMITMENSMFMVLNRINTRMRSALSSVLFHKAQRLGGQGVDFELPGADGPSKYSFVSLINVDINTTLCLVFQYVLQGVFLIPIFCALTYLLIDTIGVGGLGVMVATQCGMILLAVITVVFQTINQAAGQNAAGERITFSQELFHGIRLFKSYAWEEPVYDRMMKVREKELSYLRCFYAWQMGFYLIFFQLGPVVRIVTMTVYVSLYGDVDPVTIFTFIQLVRSFNGVVGAVLNIIPVLIGVMPAFKRLVVFMNLEEKKSLLEIEEEREKRRRSSPRPAERTNATSSSSDAVVTLRGTWKWGSDEKAPVALWDVDFQAGEGEMVAVVGSVGSGKTAFMSALLGELYDGDENCELKAPTMVGFHSQVPLIVEGSLRENILFWRPFDQERYHKVLDAACLTRDLEYCLVRISAVLDIVA